MESVKKVPVKAQKRISREENGPFFIYGVRHHGPGSAWGLLNSLHEIKPGMILIEGPPDANEMLQWLTHPEFRAPAALLVYRPDAPQKSATFPFAHFSPEFQALSYGLKNEVPVRFFDLPQAHMMAIGHSPQMPEASLFQQLAQASGHRSYEQWWNLAIEQRQNSTEMFAAILELMQTLRHETAQQPHDSQDPSARVAGQREAYMRQSMRHALAEGHERIAVICGAWHAPALLDLGNEAADAALLVDLPSVEVDVSWIPWTYGRLGKFSGYGAGIDSPGWYEHLWQMNQSAAAPTAVSVHWLMKVSQLLREEGLGTSAAHIIETVRLAQSLSALRNLPFPGLPELNEATQTVMCGGDKAPLELIKRKLIVGERMGMVPPDMPMIPLQRNVYRRQKALSLFPNPEMTTLALDLRIELDLRRSHLLHRLRLLTIPWGEVKPIRGQSGTYQEVWNLQWRPDFAIRIIEANLWGNTVLDAATAFARDAADRAAALPALTTLLNDIILADLPEAVEHLMTRIQDEAAVSSDVPHMMDALQPLARILRYGNVRKTDQAVVQRVVDGLLARICIGLPSTCAALDDDAAAEMVEKMTAVHATIHTHQNPNHLQQWQNTLLKLANQDRLHGQLAGKVTRLLLDDRIFSAAETAVRMERALSFHTLSSVGIEQLLQMAAWIDGFLQGSGHLLIHDKTLWNLLDTWLTQMGKERFQAVLPLLRRTFSTFSEAIRQEMNARIRPRLPASGRSEYRETAVGFDETQADAVLPLAARLMGLTSTDKD